MKNLTFEQMEQVNGGSWWECAAAMVGFGLSVATLPATAALGGLGAIAFYYTLGQAGYACADAFANTEFEQ